MTETKDITGQRYGRLVALQPAGSTAQGKVLWHCRCECGNTCIVRGSSLRNNTTRSCGCRKNRVKHGHTRNGQYHPLYKTWQGMRGRCNNLNLKHFKDYGGRGIQVYERWNDFNAFLNDILTSIGERPPGKTLDRINNDGNYEPGNVRWATRKEQQNNKRPPSQARNRCGFQGVEQIGTRWRVKINYNGKSAHLKMFDTPEEASKAYRYVAKKLYALTLEKNAAQVRPSS